MLPGLRARARYRFDNLMSRGIGAQILLLAALTAALVLLAAAAVAGFGVTSETEGRPDGFGRVVWKTLMHALDAGAIGGDSFKSWAFLAIMLFVTFGGIFVLSALIGVLNTGFGNRIEALRRGRSRVIERGHTVLLGFSPKVHTILAELAVAGENHKDPCAVVLAPRDKVAMDDEIAEHLDGRRLRVVTRSGSPMDLASLELVSLQTAKAIVVLGPVAHDDGTPMSPGEADTVVLKTLLALRKLGAGGDLHLVAELQDERTEAVARMVTGPGAALIVAPPLISRLLVQTGRQSGLSMVYTELLDFAGCEIYVRPEPKLLGRSFREVVSAYDSSTVLGVLPADGNLLLPPPLDRKMAPGDQLVVISEDDDTVVLDGKAVAVSPRAITAVPRASHRHRERTLVIGAGPRLTLVLRELGAYVAEGSSTLVVGDGSSLAAVPHLSVPTMTVQVRTGDVTDRGLLDELDVTSFDHVLVLSETEGRNQEMADARTMVTLLHLRDITRRAGRALPITSEILDIRNRDLAAVAEADDFIVSNTLVSLLVAQVAENRHLVSVFGELFSAGGHELYLKPVEDYVVTGEEVPFQAVVDAALTRGEIAVGYRLAAGARDAASNFGVVTNPKKSARRQFRPGDRVVVVADE